MLMGSELDAGRRVDRLARHAAVRALHHPLGARVSVGERASDQVAVGVEQAHVDAPRVDRRRLQLPPAPRPARPRPSTISASIAQGVPAQPAEHAHGRVGEAVHLLEARRVPPSKRPTSTRPDSAPRSAAT